MPAAFLTTIPPVYKKLKMSKQTGKKWLPPYYRNVVLCEHSQKSKQKNRHSLT